MVVRVTEYLGQYYITGACGEWGSILHPLVRIRFSHLTAFFNFMGNKFDCDFKNPRDSQMLRKLFRPKAVVLLDIIEKETVDEIIFRTDNARYRQILRLMARGGR